MSQEDKKFQVCLEAALNVVRENILPINKLKKDIYTASPCNDGYSNYRALWARDGSITSIAILDTGEEDFLRVAQDSFELLKETQLPLGKIAAYIDFNDEENPKIVYGGWGNIEPLDGQMWFLMLAHKLFEVTQDEKYLSEEYLEHYERAMSMLDVKANHSEWLMSWPEFAGWDDQMRRRGRVASLESLRIMALLKYSELLDFAGEKEMAQTRLNQARVLTEKMRQIFWITPDNAHWLAKPNSNKYGPGYFSKYEQQVIEYVDNHEIPFVQSFLNTVDVSPDSIKRFDTWANIWVILSGVADQAQTERIIDYILEKNLIIPFPIKTLDPVVKPNDDDWDLFYEYARNKPYQYHNGAIWPMVSGYFIQSLLKAGRNQLALEQIEKLVELVIRPGIRYKYSFAEYYDPLNRAGKIGEDAHEHQCWTAAMMIRLLDLRKMILSSENNE